MQINILYDSDVSGAPAGFTTAVTEAVNYIDKLVANNITINIQFGWGSSGATNANQPGVAAEATPGYVGLFRPTLGNTQVVASALQAAYAANGLASAVTSSVLTADLTAASSFRFLDLGYAESLALNLTSSVILGDAEGFVALNSSDNWNFDVNGPTNSGNYDSISALLHEITHVLGRFAGGAGGPGQTATVFDMFRYTSGGALQITPGGGYFSLNGSNLTLPFEPANVDPADWVKSVQNDANGYVPFGSAENFSATDMLELEALGFQLYRPAVDLRGDGNSDLLIENTFGAVVSGEWLNNQMTYTQVAGLGPEWTFKGAGDFLANGKADFLIENASGAVAVGEVTSGVTAFTQVGALGPEWKFVGTGDFLGDAKSDFLIENAAGSVFLAEVANSRATYASVANLGPEWTFVETGNFLGHGVADALLENTAGSVVVGEVVSGQMAYTQVAALGPEWRFEGAGDFLGDGKSDFLIKNTNGAVFLGEVVGGQAAYTSITALGPEWTFEGVGDYLGLGHDQFLIENTSGAVVAGAVSGGQTQFTQISALGSEWAFHMATPRV